MPSQADTHAAERLLRARERAGYDSAQAVANAFGWPDYSLDESGQRALNPARAKLYAHAFHVEPDWLLSGENEPAAGPEEGTSGLADAPRASDDLAERISRLTSAQRAALVEFLRTMQEG